MHLYLLGNLEITHFLTHISSPPTLCIFYFLLSISGVFIWISSFSPTMLSLVFVWFALLFQDVFIQLDCVWVIPFPEEWCRKSTAELADSGAASSTISVWWHLPMHIFVRWGPSGKKSDSPRLLDTYQSMFLTWTSSLYILYTIMYTIVYIITQLPLLKVALLASMKSR